MRRVACLLALILAGCATAEERAEDLAAYINENYAQACVKLGYEPGSEGHRNCMLSLYNTDQVRMARQPLPYMVAPARRIRR